MNQSIALLVACFFATAVALTPHKQRLVRDLLNNYDPNVDPGNITLNLNLNLICASVDDEVVTAHVWESHTWKDERLTWNPSEYGGVDTLRIPSQRVWTPDTTQYNSVTAVVQRDDINVVLKSDGLIIWIPRADYKMYCSGESQISCPLRVGLWTYDGYNVALESQGSDPLSVSDYQDNCPLQVSSHKADIVTHTYPCCPEPYPSLDATIVFKNRN